MDSQQRENNLLVYTIKKQKVYNIMKNNETELFSMNDMNQKFLGLKNEEKNIMKLNKIVTHLPKVDKKILLAYGKIRKTEESRNNLELIYPMEIEKTLLVINKQDITNLTKMASEYICFVFGYNLFVKIKKRGSRVYERTMQNNETSKDYFKAYFKYILNFERYYGNNLLMLHIKITLR